MKPNSYKEIVHLTAVYPKTVEDFGKAYTLLGFLGEIEEWANTEGNSEEEFKEAFDVVWYACAICKEFGLDFEDVVQSARDNIKEENYRPVNVFELVKKYYRDGKPIAAEDVRVFLIRNLYLVIADYTNEEFERGLQQNYDKLMRRRETNTIHGDGDNRELFAK